MYIQPNIIKTGIPKLLGYEEDSKLLIIHADDLGLSNSTNMACIDLFENGLVNSASLMVPCPWFPQIAEYARINKGNMDFGLHLTLTSEWRFFKWGPVSPPNDIPTLINNFGFFHSNTNILIDQANLFQIELELRNQIQRALDFGIDITHLDAHMHATKITREFLEIYLKLGQEYQLPVLLSHEDRHTKCVKYQEKHIIVDSLYQATPIDYKEGLKKYYKNILNNLSNGLSCLLVHPAFDNQEIRAITTGYQNWGSNWRQMDYDFFLSSECREIIEENDIQLITWRHIRDIMFRT